MMFGLFLFPILLGAGIAIDFTRRSEANALILESLDAASLKIASDPDLQNPEMTELAKSIFQSNINNSFPYEINSFVAARTEDGNIKVNADIGLEPLFLKVVGVNKLNIVQKSEAGVRNGKGLELVIAFDTTASMGFGNTWQTALSTLEEVLESLGKLVDGDDFHITLVPFSDRVPVGVGRTSWLTTAAPAGWNGCFEPREAVDGTYQWALDDEPPASRAFDASVRNVTGGLAGYNNGPVCPSVSLTGPTDEVSDIIDAAANFSNGGTGRFDVAMAWSWRLLSPKWRGLWGPSDYPALDTEKTRKVVVFVTDGRTEAYTHELSMMRSWGYNQGSTDGFDNLVYLCDRMKNDDIEIFMYRINGNPHAENYMQDCASSDDHYEFINNNAQLELAFRDLLVQLESLRLYQ